MIIQGHMLGMKWNPVGIYALQLAKIIFFRELIKVLGQIEDGNLFIWEILME